MRTRTKAIAVILGCVAVLGGIIVFNDKAHAKSLPKNKTPPSDDEEEIEVEVPNKDGSPSGNSIIVDEEVAEDAANDDSTTKVDEDLEVIAAEENIDKDDAIAEVVDQVTGGVKAPPLAIEEIKPALDPHGTVKLARLMLAREELPNWKKDTLDNDVGEWQANVGLKSDNEFGILSAARMADEVGLLPLIRFWPKDTYTKDQALERYREAIYSSINKLKKDLPDSQAHIDALIASVNREKAVSFGNNNPPVQKTREFISDVNEGIAAGAELKGEEALKS